MAKYMSRSKAYCILYLNIKTLAWAARGPPRGARPWAALWAAIGYFKKRKKKKGM
jgi:hypothetical protein